MSITALDKATVKKITTAQVITSVFSAVKELFENALDAGANSIDVILEELGLSYIEVRDNAKGISEVDSSYMALAAYTSKLSGFNDLESLNTYGFRGEALSALCRVADVKIMTRTEKDDAARYYTMNHKGDIEQKELCARSIGTTVQVFSLFKNIPVRRKIICDKRRANQDVEEIESLLKDFGICHPHIRINFRVDDVNRFTKLPTETVRESLTNIFGKKVISNYEFLNFNESDMSIELIIPKKDLSDASAVCHKTYSHIYVNRRPVLNKEFEKMIITLMMKYFGDKIPAKKKLIFFLMIKVPSSNVDVNLEPNKTKVLLKNMSEVLGIIEKLTVDYYGIAESDEIVQANVPAVAEESLIKFMDDTESDDEKVPGTKKPSKKRKIENNKGEPTPIKIKRLGTENKENVENVTHKLNLSLSDEETLSQMPKVDLGPDFSTQEIEKIPVLDPGVVQDVMDKLERAMVQPKTMSPPNTSHKPIQITESQWSKGQVPNLTGGTDVAVIGPSSGSASKTKKTHDASTNPRTRGFLKFSEQMGPQVKEEIPGVDFVTLATSIATKWKQLAPEERERYREIGRQEILEDQKLNVSGGRKRSSKITPEDMENNKKRMQNMIQKMEHLNTSSDNLKIKNTNQNITKVKSVRNWKVNKKQLFISSINNSPKKKNYNLIIGPLVDNNIWTVSTNSQIWALNLNQLFDTLNLDESKRKEAKANRDLVETYFKRAFNETDDMNFMHPIDFE